MNLIEQMMQESIALSASTNKKSTKSRNWDVSKDHKINESKKRRVNESVSVGDVYEMKLSDDADPRHGISNSLHGTFKVVRVEGSWAYCKPQDKAAEDWVKYMTTMDEDEIDPETLQYYDSEGLVGFEDWYLEDEFDKLTESKKLKESDTPPNGRKKTIYANTLSGLKDKVEELLDEYGDLRFSTAAISITVEEDGKVMVGYTPGWQDKQL